MGICVLKSNISIYLYHVLQKVSEVVLLVDKHLDVATGVGELWHTRCVNKEGREERGRESLWERSLGAEQRGKRETCT